MVSASNQVYQSVAILIKLCDDVLLIGHDAINAENVAEVLDLVEDAIQVRYDQFSSSFFNLGDVLNLQF